MRGLRTIFEFYVKASIHVAFAVIAFTYLTCVFLNIAISVPLFFCVFFSTIPVYNLIRNTVEEKKTFFGIRKMDRPTLILSTLALVMAGYFGMYLTWQTWLGMLGLLVLSVIYAIPVLPRGRNLRHSGLLKILIIGLVWTGTTVLLPVIEIPSQIFNGDFWIEFTQRLLLILVLMVPFEIRDLSIDPGDMLTIPQRFGVPKTRRIGLWLCFFCFFLTYVKEDPSQTEVLAKGGMVLSLIVLLLFLPKRQSRYFASFWVEAFPIFWAVILWGVSKWF